MRISLAAVLTLLPLVAEAQTPLNAIEWLGRNAPQARTPILEPPVARSAQRPDVAVQALQRKSDPVGLVPPSVTGLPVDMWQGSDVDELTRLIARAPVRRLPAMQALLSTLLLSEAESPAGAEASEALLLARIDRLIELGAADPAQTLVESAGPTKTPARFRRWLDLTLLTGDEDKACRLLNERPWLLDDYAARIFCGARSGDWQTAALTLEAVHTLELLPHEQMDLLDRFLSPDVFDGAPPLPPPGNPDPLTFRLFETIGEPLPTTALPRAFATADLRDVAGWKAQVEAAERLTRIGAMPPNRLLGLYTERSPAASGGVWDRVEALQYFDTALTQGSAEAVTKTLPKVWQAMSDAHLEVPFAALFADRLSGLRLEDPRARAIQWRLRLLSPDYEAAAAEPLGQGRTETFLAALAQGRPQEVPAPNATAQAIADGFAPGARLPMRAAEALREHRVGEAILLAIATFDSGARGNLSDLSGAIATFRKLGLEDVARRATLQLMLLDRSAP